MADWQSRTRILIGAEGIEVLKGSHVAVFGLGGVGGYAAEGLVRAGIGQISLIDKDAFELSNLNRQIFSLRSNLGMRKTSVAASRLRDINPELIVNELDCFVDESSIDKLAWETVDYCVDAIDTMTSKIFIIKESQRRNVSIVSCMGTGFRTDMTQLKIADIYSTRICPMARAMRSLAKKNDISACQVLYSTEQPLKPKHSRQEEHEGKLIGSLSFVPAAAGLMLASYVVSELLR